MVSTDRAAHAMLTDLRPIICNNEWQGKLSRFSRRKITRVLNVKILEVQRSRSNTIIFFKGHARWENCREEAKNNKTNKQANKNKKNQSNIPH